MKKLLLIIFLVLIALGEVKSQNWTESFEGLDSLSLPSGWSKYNRASFPIDPMTNWTVRDTGSSLPGLSTATAKAHSGLKSIGASWWASIDTNGTTPATSDVWLVTKRIHVWSSAAYFSYWITLGSSTYIDSVQIWVSTVDSLPQNFNNYIETQSSRGPYGVFSQYFVPLDQYVGQNIWIAFRYYTDCSVDGYFAQLDDVEVSNPIGIQQISSEVPNRYELKQNYPNPFNPVTNIEFNIPGSEHVNLVIFNSLGQEVATLVNQQLTPGTYKYDFNASGLPSGAYFYRLTAGNFVKTNKMILTK